MSKRGQFIALVTSKGGSGKTTLLVSIASGEELKMTTVRGMAFITLLTCGALTACATSTTGALPAGGDTFVVSRQAGAFPSGREPLLAEALTEAQAKCASLKKTMTLVSSTENPGPYILMNYPKATVVFTCN